MMTNAFAMTMVIARQTVWAWKQRSARPGIELAGPAGPSVPIRSLCWSPDGAQLLIGSDRTARIWRAKTEQNEAVKEGTAKEVRAFVRARLRQPSEEPRESGDALSFENEALEVQLNQIQDDHTQLQEELRSTWEFYTKRDNGVLAGSYWRAQCEKRDDSIRFLSLKLQEYTVPSAEYHSRPANRGPQGFNPVHSPPDTSPSTPSRSEKSPAFGGGAAKGHPGAMKAAERAYQALSERHSRLCEEVQAAQARAASLERDIEACEQRRRTLMQAPETGDPGTPKFVEDASEDKRFESDEVSMPTWATRCAWRL
eukprot:s3116_g7.t1